MRLAALLAELPSHERERLALEHLGRDESLSAAALCSTLEGVLRSYSFVRRFITNRLPPTFAVFETLLDAPDCAWPVTTFREAVAEKTNRLCEGVRAGDLVSREESLKIYRRVLMEARRNDLQLDGSELAILGVLRRELAIRPVEHFLIEHHDDFQEFWSRDRGFLDETNALRSCGMIFGQDGRIVLPEELAPLVRQALGIEMPSESRRRLFSNLSAADLAEVLAQAGLRTSGTRDEKLARLLTSYVQPTEVMKGLSLQQLRDIARGAKAAVSGSKDELVEKLSTHFLHSLDIRSADVVETPPPPAELRALEASRFVALFSCLRGDDLSDILEDIDSSRVTGAKETKVRLLVASPYGEATLLGKLSNRALEETLVRIRQRSSGSKGERVLRLVEFFGTATDSMLAEISSKSGSPDTSRTEHLVPAP